jgi:hypothetical protein
MAFYSSANERFEKIFTELRDSKELYFTSSQRSLLTYYFLSNVDWNSAMSSDPIPAANHDRLLHMFR